MGQGRGLGSDFAREVALRALLVPLPIAKRMGIGLPLARSVSFQRQRILDPGDRFAGSWMFAFEAGSRAWFGRNDFSGGQIQTECVTLVAATKGGEDSSADQVWERSGEIAFVGNKRVGSLAIFEGFASIELTGMNRIGRLNADLLVDGNEARRTSVYLGPREKIDPDFHNSLQHRSLFLAMRELAAMRHDGRQLAVLDRQLERIEYFLNKGQDSPSVKDYRIWIEYWQDRVLFGWRRWSSDFYRSWLRPLVALIAGYLLMNATALMVVEGFSVSDWIDLTLRPVSEIASYEASVRRVADREYASVSRSARTLLQLVGLLEVLWIGVWGFALVKAIKR